MQTITTQEVRFRDGSGKIHAICTGTVAVKKRFKEASGGRIVSKIRFVIDQEFTEPLPIWVWVIEHPEGIFLVDTGENTSVNDPGYFQKEGPLMNWVNTTQFKFQVMPADEIINQLARINLTPAAIKQVVLTHLHLDHTDGLKYFQHTDILVHDYEWKHPSFALPTLYPGWFEPKLVSLQTYKDAIFSKAFFLTEAHDLLLIATPGHTKGHCSVLAKTNAFSYLFSGDVSYDQQQLLAGTCAGAHQDFRLARSTYAAIRSYAANNKTIYLPSHDRDAADRLRYSQTLD